MDGLGLLVVAAFLILIFAIISNSCKEGFADSAGFKLPQIGPKAPLLPPKLLPGPGSSPSELPSAPIASLAETNSRPYEDPVNEKATTQMLNMLKQDMDGFSAFELPHLEDRSDPAVKLPLTRFQGDYQRVKDELLVISQTNVQPQLTIEDIDGMGANLRFLQRTYRLYAANQMVPQPTAPLSAVGIRPTNAKEGFEVQGSTDASNPITPDQLSLLNQKILVEITRLQASGTTDPVIQARVDVFMKMQQTVSDLDMRIKSGTLAAKDIPIQVKDYDNFLPALGNQSAGIGGLISKAGLGSLSSLFNAYDAGDISGSALASALIDKYAEDLMKGLSYKVNLSYTSPNEVAKKNAESAMVQNLGLFSGLGNGVRGEFDAKIKELEIAGFSSCNRRESSATAKAAGRFDWKARSDAIEQNIKKAGLNPADFGALPKGAQVSSDYSWRGHAKMMCSRLAAHIEPGYPEQMGCPPVSWKGWRL